MVSVASAAVKMRKKVAFVLSALLQPIGFGR